MSNTDYISKEVNSIIENSDYEFPKNLAMASAWILGNLKAFNLKVLDTQNFSSLADYFIIASASNTTQAQAMADTILRQLKQHGAKARSTEGLNGADWILIDMADVIVHIFLDSSRPIYDLDNLWSYAKDVEIPQDYYFSSDDDEEVKTPSDGSEYF